MRGGANDKSTSPSLLVLRNLLVVSRHVRGHGAADPRAIAMDSVMIRIGQGADGGLQPSFSDPWCLSLLRPALISNR
jgi:hypothetical protein